MQNFFTPENSSPIAVLIKNISENNSNTDSAYFDNQHLTNNDVNNLCAGLPNNTYLKTINLALTNLKIPQLSLILNAIKQNKSITVLILPHAKDDPEEFKLLLEETQEHITENNKPGLVP